MMKVHATHEECLRRIYTQAICSKYHVLEEKHRNSQNSERTEQGKEAVRFLSIRRKGSNVY